MSARPCTHRHGDADEGLETGAVKLAGGGGVMGARAHNERRITTASGCITQRTHANFAPDPRSEREGGGMWSHCIPPTPPQRARARVCARVRVRPPTNRQTEARGENRQ